MAYPDDDRDATILTDHKLGELAHASKQAAKDSVTRQVFELYYHARRNLVEPMRDLWQEHYRAYRSMAEVTDDDIGHNLFLPLTFTHVESYLPRLVGATPRVEIWERGAEDRDRAAFHRGMFRYFWQAMNLPLETMLFAKDAEIYGGAWWRIGHKTEMRNRVTRTYTEAPRTISLGSIEIPIPGTARPRFEKRVEEVLVEDMPTLSSPDIDMVYPDPSGTSVESCRYIIEEMEVEVDDLDHYQLDGKPLYDEKVIDELKELVKPGAGQNFTDETTLRQRLRDDLYPVGSTTVDDTYNPLSRKVRLLKLDTDDREIVVVKDFPHLAPLRHAPNQYGVKPWVLFTPCPQRGELYGPSVPEMLMALNVTMNTLVNSRLDNVLMAVHRMLLVMRDSNIDARDIQWRPGGIIEVDDPGDIQPFGVPSPDLTAHRDLDFFHSFAQLATGANDTLTAGSSGLTGGTATEAAILDRAATSRAALVFKVLSWQALTPLARLLIRDTELFKTRSEVLRIVGDDFTQVQYQLLDPKVLAARQGTDLDVEIDIAASEPVTREAKLRSAVNALQLLAPILGPEHRFTQRLIVQAAQGFGFERPEDLAVAPPQETQAPGVAPPGPPEGSRQDLSGQSTETFRQLFGGGGEESVA